MRTTAETSVNEVQRNSAIRRPISAHQEVAAKPRARSNFPGRGDSCSLSLRERVRVRARVARRFEGTLLQKLAPTWNPAIRLPHLASAATSSLRLLARLAFTCVLPTLLQSFAHAAEADLILHGGKVVTVDDRFSIQEAIAIEGGRIVQLGRDSEALKRRGPRTDVVDLQGRLVLPGLMDSHAHPADACMTELDHPIPPMESIPDVLDYIQARARALKEGEWIEVHQVFITRLREQRYPTRAELDRAAPRHPVLFATGPDASLNSLALKLSGIDRDFKVTDGGSGFAEKDSKTGEPTGILRNCTRYVKVKSSKHQPTRAEKVERLRELFADYNAVGLTSVCDRNAGSDEIETYKQLRASGSLTVRVSLSQHIDSIGSLTNIQASIRRVAQDPLFKERDDWLRIVGIKTFLDGGMLTGSAYMRQPWGVSEIYGISDPDYRGVLFIPKDRLVPMVRAAVESGLQFTAHSVGDGAVHALLEAYAEVDKEAPVRKTRPCISHSNFMSREAVEQAARLGVMVDIQPAWLYLDTRTLAKQFGYERLRYFQPLHSLFEAGAVAGGGSDHMQKIGSLRSVNPYNPFLGMATAITRQAKQYESRLHPEEALTREQAIRFYTINNARVLGCDDKLGTLEPGKLADLIVLDSNLLTCPEDQIAATRVLRTYVGGKLVYPPVKTEKP
ncbi:MAG: amidohydrolase [Verrucomicrobia bacterium]|nr:MAG: amidohydrolase [Verrucomicrobiota bacterium]